MSHEDSFADDDISFISQIRSNPYLEKEEAYVKLNRELEKKTSDLIMRFEKYSKSRSKCSGSMYEGGDNFSELGTDDGLSSFGDGEFSSISQADNYEDQRELQSRGGLRNSNSSTTLFEKLAILSSVQESEDRVKKPSRLQRATESVIKSLHAKLVNHEERLADLHLQYRHKIQENTILESKVKALEDERERQLRTINNLHSIVEKHAKSAESSKSNLNLRLQNVVSMKKELSDYKRENKLNSANSQSLQTRLNRSLEENERMKNQNKAIGLHMRELESEFKSKYEQQRQRIIELEKQKTTQNSTIKKQACLIRTLRDKVKQ